MKKADFKGYSESNTSVIQCTFMRDVKKVSGKVHNLFINAHIRIKFSQVKLRYSMHIIQKKKMIAISVMNFFQIL